MNEEENIDFYNVFIEFCKFFVTGLHMQLNELENEIFRCAICKHEFELAHDKPVILKGSFENIDLNIEVCEYCICILAEIKEI